MDIDDVAAAGFSSGADDYERGRPSYPADAVSWLAEQLSIGPGCRVVDVAAGTGKLTRMLLDLGAEVVAVEPVDEMRAHLARTCPGAEAHAGTAEDLPLGDGSVDAVTVAQAFHWFDPTRAMASFGRVLRPGGGFGIIFNERDVREPWVADLNHLIRWDRRDEYRVPYTVEVDWVPVLAEAAGPFTPAERYDTTYHQAMDPDLLVARVMSTSYLAVLDHAEKDELGAQVRELVAPLGDAFDMPYVTVAYAAHRT